MSTRSIKRIVAANPTVEGAGVRIRRAFGFGDTGMFDPFLLLDDFRNDNPDDYVAGFPWHPHRGIETVTYMLAGTVRHGDSLGNQGTLQAGDVQWMTAGSGILHQEMPEGDRQGRMHGFQLWVNLPASLKMTCPRYQDIAAADIPVITDDDGTTVRIICGNFLGKSGPVDGVAADPRYLDVRIPPRARKALPVDAHHKAFAYVFDGAGRFGETTEPADEAGNRSLILFDTGDEVVVRSGDEGVRFLMISGMPIAEPVAWRGPIVMNSAEQINQAYAELRDGTFIKH